MSETISKKRKFVLGRIMHGQSNYWAKFQVDGVEYALRDNPKRVIKGPSYSKEDEAAIIKWNYTKDNRFYGFEIDPNDKHEAEFLAFLKKDSRIFVKGGTRQMSSITQYELIDINGDEINTALEIKKRAKVSNIIYSMPLAELVKLCYYFNANIANKTKEGIYNLLLHWETGYLFKSMKAGGKDIVPMDVILEQGFGSEFEIRTAVNKAIILGVIKMRGGVYYLGELGNPIGSTPEQIYSFMEQNKQIFDGSLQYLLKDEKLPESIDYSNELSTVEFDFGALNEAKKEEIREFTGEFTPQERMKYIAEAKSIGVQGNIDGFKDETLYYKVIDRRKYNASKEAQTAQV